MLRTSVVPVFSSIAATAPLAEDVARRIMPLRASLYEAGNITVHYRLDRQGRLLIGARGPQKPIRDTQPIGYLKSYAARLWPELAGVEWTHGWNGQLAMTQDQYPHLHEPAAGLLVGLGYNGRGVPMGTAMGRQIARRILGERVDMPVTPIVPIAFHRFWRLGVAARVWQGRVRDRLGL